MQAHGQEDAPDKVYLEAVEIEGLERTKPFVIERELLVEPGSVASVGAIEESVQRVRNTGLFRKVRYELVEASGTSAGDRDLPEHIAPHLLRIEVDEKWTMLPITSFNRGGGTFRLVLGAYDTNVLGRYIGAGGQYERLGETNSFYLWAYHPRAFGQRLQLGVDLGSRNRFYTFFDEHGETDGGFLLDRFTAGVSANKEWKWWLRTQAGLRWNDDDFSLALIPTEIANRQRERGVPEPAHTLSVQLNTSIGRIDQDNYLYDGVLLSTGVEHANPALGSTHALTRLHTNFRYFQRLPLRANLGVRMGAATARVETVYHRYFLGGLDTLRGFARDRFAGEHYWLAGAELRIPSVDTRWFVLQHIFFVDSAGVSDDLADVATLSGVSAGLGVRFIVPKIHGFIARVDYAFPLVGNVPSPLSLGGGQFF